MLESLVSKTCHELVADQRLSGGLRPGLWPARQLTTKCGRSSPTNSLSSATQSEWSLRLPTTSVRRRWRCVLERSNALDRSLVGCNANHARTPNHASCDNCLVALPMHATAQNTCKPTPLLPSLPSHASTHTASATTAMHRNAALQSRLTCEQRTTNNVRHGGRARVWVEGSSKEGLLLRFQHLRELM